MSTAELYEKCAECHLFVEPNDAFNPVCEHSGTRVHEFRSWACIFCRAPQLAEYIHLHRGDDDDEAIDGSHEAKPSGQIATLTVWRQFGPPEMQRRFEQADAIKNGLHDWQPIMAERCERCGELAWGPYPTDVQNAKQMVGPCRGTDDD